MTRGTATPARDARRDSLRKQVATWPGWAFYETAHYFIVTSVDDEEFVRELQERCESIRHVIEADWPRPESIPALVDREPSVIRVCKDRDQFQSYGGSLDSSGYWSWVDQEMVLYDDKAGGGRGETWATLNGRICAEYMYEQGGSNAATWFLEGNADYYAGFKLKGGAYVPNPFSWRERTMQENIRVQRQSTLDGKSDRAYAPLEQLVRFTQREYYGQNKLHLDGAANCAQGWSLIWFLRRGKSGSQLWQPAWDRILDTWWSAWLDTRDSQIATERAFAGVDWTALEAAWSSFTLVN